MPTKNEANEAFVREFQARNGLAVDGWAGMATLGALDVLKAPVPASVGTKHISEAGTHLIHSFEGYRATTYPDPGPTGLPVTGGYGSTLDENGQPFALGVTHDKAYWDKLFARDIGKFERAVTEACPVTTQNQFDALVSFAYNVGIGNLKDSTLREKHNAGDYVGAKAQFLRWNKAKGVVLNGLTKRRAAEAELYGK